MCDFKVLQPTTAVIPTDRQAAPVKIVLFAAHLDRHLVGRHDPAGWVGVAFGCNPKCVVVKRNVVDRKREDGLMLFLVGSIVEELNLHIVEIATAWWANRRVHLIGSTRRTGWK